MKNKIIIFLFFICIDITSQSISYNEAFPLNPNLTGSQWNQSTITLTNDQIVTCWIDSQEGGSYNIHAKISDQYGSVLVSEFLVNTYINESGYRWKPSLAKINDDRFVICWESLRQDGDGMGVFGQVFNSKGIRIGNEFRINSITLGDQKSVSVSGLSKGGFVACWLDEEIYAQIFDEYGNKIGDEFMVNSSSGLSQAAPTVEYFLNGGFVVSWHSYTTNTTNFAEVYFQIFDDSGTKIGEEIIANTYLRDNQTGPFVKSLSNNEFIICWNSFEQDGSALGIFAQIFDTLGNKLDDEFQINTFVKGVQSSPCVEKLSNDRFIIAWSSSEQIPWSSWGQTRSVISAQIYDSNLEKIGIEFKINSQFQYSNSNATFAPLSNGSLYVSWFSGKIDIVGHGIYALYYLGEPINHDLKEFKVLTPELDSINTLNPLFTWSGANILQINYPWELTYDIYIDSDSKFQTPILINNVQDTSYYIDSLTPGMTFFWKVLAKNIDGDSLWSLNVNSFHVNLNATDVQNREDQIIDNFELHQNYPNPFNPTTIISYSLPQLSKVTIKIFDVMGNEISTLVNGERQTGSFNIEFDASGLSSGVYFYRIVTDKFNETKKMLLLR